MNTKPVEPGCSADKNLDQSIADAVYARIGARTLGVARHRNELAAIADFRAMRAFAHDRNVVSRKTLAFWRA
jgi:hypothetical protein